MDTGWLPRLSGLPHFPRIPHWYVNKPLEGLVFTRGGHLVRMVKLEKSFMVVVILSLFQLPRINSSFCPRRKYDSSEPASPGSKCPGFVVSGVLVTASSYSDRMGLHRLMLNSI